MYFVIDSIDLNSELNSFLFAIIVKVTVTSWLIRHELNFCWNQAKQLL